MTRPFASGLLGVALLAACQVQAPTPPVTQTTSLPPAPATPAASTPPPTSPPPASPAPPVATPTASSRGRLGVGYVRDPGVPVGQTVQLTALVPENGTPVGSAATWRLDVASAARARIVDQAEGRCTVAVTAPGPIRLFTSTAAADAEVLLVGVATPAPGTPDPGYPGRRVAGPRPLDGVYVIRSAVEWARYWEASRQQDRYIDSAASPRPAPDVDWETQSLVLLAATSTGGHPPVLAEVDPAGAGRVVAVRPVVWSGAPGPSSESTSLRVYRTARLPATTVVDYTCEDRIGCPTGPLTLPVPDPFAGVEGRVLTVGQPFALPAGWVGEPLQWSLAARTAARAELVGNQLRPLAPGGLVLEVRAGERMGYVLHAIQADPPPTRPIAGPYFPHWASGFTTPVVAHDEAGWQGLWADLWSPRGPIATPDPSASLHPPTAPPPPPPAPAIAFPEAGQVPRSP